MLLELVGIFQHLRHLRRWIENGRVGVRQHRSPRGVTNAQG
jgi:hypothetical protein